MYHKLLPGVSTLMMKMKEGKSDDALIVATNEVKLRNTG